MTTNQGTAGQGVGASFTPGPWRVDDRRDASGALQVQAQHRGEGSSYCVASVNFWEAPDANARLIAAAPELYEALAAAGNALRFHADSVTHHGASPELRAKQAALYDQANAAFAALAKARGES